MIKIPMLLLTLANLILGPTLISPSVTEPTDFTITTNITTDGVTDAHQVRIQIVPAELPILEWMRELTPLRKVHYSWALPQSLMDATSAELYEYVRLSNACSLSAQWGKDYYLDICVQVCKRVNLTSPKHAASIGLNYSPFHFRYPNNPGGDPPLGFPDEDGDGVEDVYQQELDRALLRFTMMKDQLAAANAAHNTNIEVTAIILDSENFRYKDAENPDPVWNAAITEKYQAIQDIVEGSFPNARIEWYGRGQFVRGACNFDPSTGGQSDERKKDGWCYNNHHPRDFSGPGYSANVVLYEPENGSSQTDIFRKTVEYAAEHGITVVTPWIALNAGYRTWNPETNQVDGKNWTSKWNYDLVHSWNIGGKIDNPWYGNRENRLGPWNASEIAIFYPPPFGDRTNDWGRHFIAYVRGAYVNRTLP